MTKEQNDQWMIINGCVSGCKIGYVDFPAINGGQSPEMLCILHILCIILTKNSSAQCAASATIQQTGGAEVNVRFV